jgi:hypothetical protein
MPPGLGRSGVNAAEWRRRGDTEAATRPRRKERQAVPRRAKHEKEELQMQAKNPAVRRLVEEADRMRWLYEQKYRPMGGTRLVQTKTTRATPASWASEGA